MNIPYDELYTGWINHEKENMKQNNFKEENVYRRKKSINHDYVPDFKDALFTFWDWQSRKIPIQHYTVHESHEIKKALVDLDNEQRNAYEEIKNKFIAGDTLYPYQRHLDDQLYQKSYLYKHWGIEHLHLNKLVNYQKNVTPCKHIIFIRITGNNAYFIDITKHEDFHNERLLKIIDDNWPNQLLISMNLSSSSDTSIKPNIIKGIREKNCNIISTINGKPIWSGYSVNGAGGRNASVQQYNTAVCILKTLKNIINSNLSNVEILNKVLFTIPIGYGSGIVIFDYSLGNDKFKLLYTSKVDHEYIDVFMQHNLQLLNISIDDKENLIKIIRYNDNVLCSNWQVR